MFANHLLEAAALLLDDLRRRNAKIVTAESCTGGLICGLLTEIAGSSDVVDRGFVTYSNAAKTACLGVPADLIARVGAVSEEVARAMAAGALAHADATLAVAVTGIAGPGSGSAGKPVGLVHLCAANDAGRSLHLVRRYGDIGRGAVRLATVADALDLVRQVMD